MMDTDVTQILKSPQGSRRLSANGIQEVQEIIEAQTLHLFFTRL